MGIKEVGPGEEISRASGFHELKCCQVEQRCHLFCEMLENKIKAYEQSLGEEDSDSPGGTHFLNPDCTVT